MKRTATLTMAVALIMLALTLTPLRTPLMPTGECKDCVDACELMGISIYNNCIVAYPGQTVYCQTIAQKAWLECIFKCQDAPKSPSDN
jgi:hypothetical protein